MVVININKINSYLIIIFFLGVLLISGCAEKETIKIGVLADLTGDYASVLRGIHRGVELAVEDLQKELDVSIQTIIEDQKSCDTKETATIMNKFVTIDKVDMIIGGTCSSTTLAAAPIAERSKTIMISSSSSAPSISQAGDYVFRTYSSDILRAKEASKLTYNLGKRRMAIIIDISNDASVELGKGGKEEFLSLGGEVLSEERTTKTDIDFRTQITKIKNLNPDVLYIASTGPNQIALIAKQARELGLNVQLIAPPETVEDPQVIELGGNAVEGLIYVMPGNPPENPTYQEIKKKYEEKYGEEELPTYITEAYDATVLGVKAILASDGTKEDIKNKLYKVSKDYDGVSGNVTFDENGDVTKSVIFKQIKNGEFVPYKE